MAEVNIVQMDFRSIYTISHNHKDGLHSELKTDVHAFGWPNYKLCQQKDDKRRAQIALSVDESICTGIIQMDVAIFVTPPAL